MLVNYTICLKLTFVHALELYHSWFLYFLFTSYSAAKLLCYVIYYIIFFFNDCWLAERWRNKYNKSTCAWPSQCSQLQYSTDNERYQHSMSKRNFLLFLLSGQHDKSVENIFFIRRTCENNQVPLPYQFEGAVVSVSTIQVLQHSSQCTVMMCTLTEINIFARKECSINKTTTRVNVKLFR